MPGGWERINNKKSTPNKNVVFIKPLPGPYEKISQDYLERIAAQCLPIMNKHHLAVVSFEEYEPNHEFWGKVALLLYHARLEQSLHTHCPG
jgi:DNA-dependent metalloprotease WSS1